MEKHLIPVQRSNQENTINDHMSQIQDLGQAVYF